MPCDPGGGNGRVTSTKNGRVTSTTNGRVKSTTNGRVTDTKESQRDRARTEEEILPGLVDKVRIGAAEPSRNTRRLQPPPLAVCALLSRVHRRAAESEETAGNRRWRAALRAPGGKLELRGRHSARVSSACAFQLRVRMLTRQVPPG